MGPENSIQLSDRRPLFLSGYAEFSQLSDHQARFCDDSNAIKKKAIAEANPGYEANSQIPKDDHSLDFRCEEGTDRR